MRLAFLIGWLVVASPALAQTTVLARGDFDGDGRGDIVERAPVAEIASRLDAMKRSAGSPSFPLLIKRFSDQWGPTAVAAQLAARPDTAFALAFGASDIQVETRPAGRYAFETPVDAVLGPMVLTTRGDIIVLTATVAGKPHTTALIWEDGRFISRALLGAR